MITKEEVASGILSDTAIRQYWGNGIFVESDGKGDLEFNLEKQLQPGSIDLHFRNEIKRFKLGHGETLSFDRIAKQDYLNAEIIPTNKSLIIQPGEIILTTTLERVILSENFAAFITGRSSFARLGLMVQCCQDYINPGLKNSIALQLVNLSQYPIELNVRTPICQLVLFKLSCSPSIGYSEKRTAKYRGENTFIPSKISIEQGSITEPSNLHEAEKQKVPNKEVLVFLHNYIEPFLPSIIMLIIITPFINKVSNVSVLQTIQQAPIGALLAIIAIVLYIILKRDRSK